MKSKMGFFVYTQCLLRGFILSILNYIEFSGKARNRRNNGELHETRHDQPSTGNQDAEHEIAKLAYIARVIATGNDDFIDLVRHYLERHDMNQ